MNMNTVTPIADWDAYSLSFQSVMPSQMLNLNREVSSYMFGNVADFGCGGGKIIPFIMDRGNVESYTGIDSSADMVKKARWMAQQFASKPAVIIDNTIEAVDLQEMDSALSINSFYTWGEPERVLSHIFHQLKAGALFVLATINSAIDMPTLLNEAEMELIAHPHWLEFKNHNLSISESDYANFIEMDDLIKQVQNVGFKVEEAHKNLYLGGLNFLVLLKE